MKATIKTRLYIVCPSCGEGETRVCHLNPGQSFGPWFCDNCGHGYAGTRTAHGADISPFDKDRKVMPAPKLLLEYIHDPRLKFVINGTRDAGEDDAEWFGHQLYYYNEHTCPDNIMRSVEYVIFELDRDPHGIFELVKEVPQDFMDQEELDISG